jgi:UTP-glucose-1-phosphate uridylyltransferase
VKPTLLVLAAGIGSRYGGLKQIDPVGPDGEIIIDYSIYDAIRAGYEKVVFIIREDLQDAFREKFEPLKDKIEMAYAFQKMELPEGYPSTVERAKPWGTGHAVLAAKDHISDPFAVINADDYYGPEAYTSSIEFIKNMQPKGSSLQFALVGYEIEKTLSDFGTVSRGIGISNEKDELVSIKEHHNVFKREGKIFHNTDGTEEEVTSNNVSMNFWIFVPEIFNELEKQFKNFVVQNTSSLKAEFLIPLAVDNLIQGGKCVTKVIRTNAQWFGVTYKEDKALVEKAIRELIDKKVYPSPLW